MEKRKNFLNLLHIYIAIFLVIQSASLFSEVFIPEPPSLNASSYILIEANTGKVIAEKDADIEHLNETNEEFRPSDEDEFNN